MLLTDNRCSVGASLVGPRSSRNDEGGFSLIEVMTASIIAVIAVVGLAYTFGMGRGFIDRFAIARAALGAARARLETLASLPPGSLELTTTPPPHTANFVIDGTVLGTESWDVAWIDDPADGVQGSGDLNGNDLKRATVTVTFRQGSAVDSVRLTRLLPR